MFPSGIRDMRAAEAERFQTGEATRYLDAIKLEVIVRTAISDCELERMSRRLRNTFRSK